MLRWSVVFAVVVPSVQRLPQELATEGALAALRLITEVRGRSWMLRWSGVFAVVIPSVQRLPQELATEGALAALRLITEVRGQLGAV
jgi:hypothetical protein